MLYNGSNSIIILKNRKRDGKMEEFRQEKIGTALLKALTAMKAKGGTDYDFNEIIIHT